MKITLFTGAGISAESGIPTFRDFTDKTKIRPEDMTREEYVAFSTPKISDDVKPNRWHYAIKRLAEKHEVYLYTQNVDSLHEKAGYPNTVFHVHGTSDNPVLFGSPVHHVEDFLRDCCLSGIVICLGTSLFVNPWLSIICDELPVGEKWLFTKELDPDHAGYLMTCDVMLGLGSDCFEQFEDLCSMI